MDLLLIARIAGEQVAIPAGQVEAVVEIEGITAVPRASTHVAGLAALRSRVLTVIDCKVSLELGASEPSATHEAIVVPCDGHPYALLLDGVDDVVPFTGQIDESDRSWSCGAHVCLVRVGSPRDRAVGGGVVRASVVGAATSWS